MLPEEKRTQLDGIVQQMVANKEADSDIQFVVNDFKSKYDVAATSPKTKESPGLATDLKNVGREFVEGISNPKPSYVRNQVDPVVLGPALNVAGQTGKAFGGALMAGGKAAVNALPDAITAPFKDMGTTVLKSLKGNPIVDAAVTAFNALPEESRTDWGNTANALNLIGLPPVARGTAAITKEGVNIARDLGTLTGQAAKKGIGKLIPNNAPQSLIDSGAKWSTTLAPDARKDLSKIMLKEKINLSPKGYDKLKSTIDDINGQIKTALEPHADEMIDASEVVKRTSEARKKAAKSYDPASEIAKVDEEAARFLDNWGDNLTVADAQSIKQDIYKQLKSHYDSVSKGGPGKYTDGEIAAKKNIARGLKEEIENAIDDAPIRELNARETQLLKLEPHLRRAVNRIENHNILSLDDVLSAGVGTTVGGFAGGPVGAAIGAAAGGAAKRALGHPGTKSRLAMALDGMQNAEISLNPKSATGKAIMGQLSGLDDLLARETPGAVPIPRRPIAKPNTMEVGPVRSGVLRGESYAPPQTLWKQKPKMLPAGQGFELKGGAYGPDVIDVPFRSNSKPILALPGEMQSPLRIPWQDFQLNGSPYQEGVLVGKPYGNVLRPIRPDPPIDAEFTSNIRGALPAPNTEGKFLLPQGQGFELVDRVSARPPEEALKIIQKQQPQDEFIGSNLRAARERMKARETANERQAENLVTRVQQLGGIQAGKDYNARILRQNPDAKRVLNNARGQAPDTIASQLQAEGWPITSGDELIELLKSGKGRTIYNPQLQDKLFTRDIRRAENEWIEKQLEKEQFTAGEAREAIPDHQARIIDEIGQEGIIAEGKLDQALNEVSDFFAEMSGKAKQTVRDIKQSATDEVKGETTAQSLKRKLDAIKRKK